MLFLALGQQWGPVILNGTKEDYKVLGSAHGRLMGIQSFWINGSTNVANLSEVKLKKIQAWWIWYLFSWLVIRAEWIQNESN